MRPFGVAELGVRHNLMKLLFPILFLALSACSKSHSYANFSGAVDRVYIEDGAGGMIMFTPYSDGPPMKNVYVYKNIKAVYLTIKDDWAEIYIPEHRTKYVLPASRIVQFHLVPSKENNTKLTEQYRQQLPPTEPD